MSNLMEINVKPWCVPYSNYTIAYRLVTKTFGSVKQRNQRNVELDVEVLSSHQHDSHVELHFWPQP